MTTFSVLVPVLTQRRKLKTIGNRLLFMHDLRFVENGVFLFSYYQVGGETKRKGRIDVSRCVTYRFADFE